VSNRVLLEGLNLEELKIKIRDEFGPDARIVHADRVRSGGIGGFFAREHYELTVDVPDKARRSPRALGRAVQARGIDALLDAADAADGPAGALKEPAPVSDWSASGEDFLTVLKSVQILKDDRVSEAVKPEMTPTQMRAANPTFTPLFPHALLTDPAPSRVIEVPVVIASPPVGLPLMPSPKDTLATLGVPRALLARLPDGTGALSALMGVLPKTPELNRTAGAVHVVAGELTDPTVRHLTDRLGGTGSEVGSCSDPSQRDCRCRRDHHPNFGKRAASIRAHRRPGTVSGVGCRGRTHESERLPPLVGNSGVEAPDRCALRARHV
jgi:hypothetical protein